MASSSDGDTDETKNMSIDSAWELKRYAYILSRLQQDSDFPSRFDLEELNEEDETQRKLKEFAQERILLHDWIKNGKLEEVKEFTLKNKSKYYLNDWNHSATFTALKSRKFKIYAYLQSIGVGFAKYESNGMDKLNDVERNELRDVMFSNFRASQDSHILYITSKLKINSPDSFEHSKEVIRGYLDKLDKIEGVSIILKVIEYVDNLSVVLDLNNKSLKMVCPGSSNADKGMTLAQQGRIYIAAGNKRSENEILGTMAHELTHMAMEAIFKNNCNPYSKSDRESREEFQTLALFVEDNIARIKDSPSGTLIAAFNYPDHEQPSELIARVPHILAQFADGKDWIEKNVPGLLKFYKENVIPKCEKFIKENHLLKPKSLNRYMNESEGEFINIKKFGLIFDKIDKLRRFLNDSTKNIFALITNCTWLGLLRCIQAMYGSDYIESYDKFLVFKLESIVKNLKDVEYVFNSEATETLFVECPDNVGDNYKSLKSIGKMIKIVRAKDKKIIFVTKEDEDENFLEILDDHGLSDTFAKESDEEFSLCELDSRSRWRILGSTVLFQGKEGCLRDLVNGNEDLLKCVNGEIMQDILNKKKIEIGSKPLGMSSLEGAYADVLHEVNLSTLLHEMKFSNDIFLICGKKKQFDKRLIEVINSLATVNLKNFEHEITNNKRIFLTDEDVSDDDFKKFCDSNSEKKIYLIKKSKKSTFMLSKVYNPDFYFKRQIKKFKQIIIKTDFHLERVSDMFIIVKGSGNTLRNNYNSSNIMLVESEKTEIEFEKLRLSAKAVHVLMWENDKLIWVKSHGSLSGLRKVIDKNLGEEIVMDENEFGVEIKDQKVLILTDEPGMGKSTTLTQLYGTETISDTHWIIRINLKDHLIPIRNLNEDVNIKQVTKFLMSIDSKLGNDFSRKLLKAALDINRRFSKILLLCLDGFDELSDDKDRKKIITLLKFLNDNTKCKIWITSRLHFKEILENELSVSSVKFNPIDDQSKVDFIKNYMKVRLRLILTKEKFDEVFTCGDGVQEGSILWTYVKAFIDKAKSIFKENVEKFIGTPLQLHLLLENSAPSFQNWMESLNEREPNFPYLGNNLLEVYEKFFERKYEIYYRKNNLLQEEQKGIMKETLDKYHEKIAHSLVNNKELGIEITKWKSSLLLLGITKAAGDLIEFVHFTFREYFFARYLITNFINQDYSTSLEDLYRFFIEEILVNEKYHLIRSFINESLRNVETKKSLTMHELGFRTAIISMMAGNNLDRTPFHCAVEEFHSDILDFIYSLKFSRTEYSTIFLKKFSYKPFFSFISSLSYVRDHVRFDKSPLQVTIFILAVIMKNDSAFNRTIEITSKWKLDQQLLTSADDQNMTPLHWAVQSNNDLAFNKLIELASKHNLDQQLLTNADNKGSTPFHWAVREKYDLAFNKLIELASKHNLDQQLLTTADYKGMTPLHWAVEVKNDFAFNKLIELASKHNLDQQLLTNADNKGSTPFHWAVREKYDLAFNKLIELASKHNLAQQLLTKADNRGSTPLHFAVRSKNDLAFNKLIELASKYNLDQQLLTTADNKGMTPLHSAVEEGNDFAFNKLIGLASKYNPDQLLLANADKGGMTPLHFAVRWKNDLAFNKLIELASKYNLDQQLLTTADNKGMTPLHYAVRSNNDLAFNKLIELASKYNLEQLLLTNADNEAWTPLHFAVQSKNDLAFNKLLEFASKHNLDQELLTTSDNKGSTPLHWAVEEKNDFAFNKLIELASKYNLEQLLLTNADDQNMTPLHWAVQSNNDLAFNKLIELASKHNLDQQLLTNADNKGSTPLHFAVRLKNDLAFNKLLELASKHNLEQQLLTTANNQGWTPLHWAIGSKNDFAFNKLIELASKYNLAQQLLTNADKEGTTPLHSAVALKNDLAFNKLIEFASKFNLDQQLLSGADNEGWNPLHFAVRLKNDLAFNKLLELASKHNLEQQLLTTANNQGWTPLHWAIGSKNDFAFIKLIELASKHNLDQQLLTNADNLGMTPLHWAVEWKNDFAFIKLIELASKHNLDEQLLTNADNLGMTPLHWAVEWKNGFAFIKLIELASKHNLDQQLLTNADKEGMTPLHWAVKSKNDLAFNKLIELASKHNLDEQLLNNADNRGSTPLHWAVEEKNDFAFDELIGLASKHNLDQQLLTNGDKEGMTPLHSAVRWKNDFAFNKLIELASKYNLDQQFHFFNNHGRTLFHEAVIYENDLAVGKMIEMASKYHLDRQHDLLSNVNIAENTVFHVVVAQARNHFTLDRLIDMLSKFSPDKIYELLRIANKDKQTVLHLAVEKEQRHNFNRILEIVSTLSLNQQYNLLNIENKAGETVFQAAVNFKNSGAVNRITKMLSESGFNLKQE